MAIEFVCPSCGGTLQVGDESAGRIIRCGGCMTALRVPAADTANDPGPAAPNPYGGQSYPPPPPRRSSAPTEVEPLPDDPPAVARPVAPRRDRDRDESDGERRSRRRPPPPAGKGVFFWLVIIGAVMLVGVVGCCGGLFLMLPDTKWQTHESKAGSFKVELPGKPQPDVAKATGLKLEKGMRAEGTVLLRRAEKFMVIYRDIDSTKDRTTTDEQELEAQVATLQKVMKSERLLRNDGITVNGFSGREIEFQAETGWHTARIIVADTRVYIVLVGGGMAQPGDAEVKQFLDSFKITDPKLLAEGKRREEQAKVAREREAKRKAEEEEEQKRRADDKRKADAAREADDLHDAAESVAGMTMAIARRTRPAPPPAPVAPPPRPVDG